MKSKIHEHKKHIKMNLTKKLAYIFILFPFAFLSAQVGIGTQTPKTDLHVVGDLQIVKELKVGGTQNTEGDPGTSGEILVSSGSTLAPEWRETVNLEVVPKIVCIALRTNSTTVAAGSDYVVAFNSTPKMLSAYISYNSTTRRFKILKAGYYKISANVQYNVIDVANTEGTIYSRIMNTTSNTQISGVNSYHHAITITPTHKIAGVSYFDLNSEFELVTSHSRQNSLSEAQLSVLFFREQ